MVHVEIADPVFESIRHLGEGTTARVELVRLRTPLAGLPAGTEVALKRPLDASPGALERSREAFAAEVRAGQRATDPSLVRVLHEGEDAEGPYLVTSFVPGRTLREILRSDGPLPEPLLRRVGAQLAGALATLHAAGFVHGDVKPENIRLDEEGTAVLLDLGFARGIETDDPEPPQAGSLAYLSPERAKGASPSTAADVFALGVVLYELATGVHPFGYAGGGAAARGARGLGYSSGELLRRSIEVPGADELLAAIATCRVVLASQLTPDLSPFLEQVLADVLERVPSRRPAAAHLAERLREGEASTWWRTRMEPDAVRLLRPAPEGSLGFPLVGREEELATLKEGLDAVRLSDRKASRVVWLAGPEGSGKWRLVNEFAQRARLSAEPPLYLYARCNDRSEARPGGALLVLLHRYLQLPPGTAPGEREEERLRELVVPGAARTLLLALGAEEAGGMDHSPAAALSEWMAALGRRSPTIVFVDDLHRGGTETLVALNTLVDALSSTRLLLILGTRDDREPDDPRRFTQLLEQLESRGAREADLGFRWMRLGPLTEEHVRQLVGGLFHRNVPRRRLARVLWLRSRGNPALLTELLRDLHERGAVRPASPPAEGLELVIDPDELPLPTSLRRIVSERFAALDQEDRLWLERISVVGGRIEPEFLVRAFPPAGRVDVDSVLARLVRKHWLVPAATRYRFQRPALREFVYRSISLPRRREMHLAAARAIEDEDSNEALYQRIYHLRAAGDDRASYQHSVRLALRLREQASATRLLTVARWGLEAMEALGPAEQTTEDRLLLLEVAADAADRLGQRDEERKFLDHLADVDMSVEGNPSQGARMYLLHGRYAANTGQFGLARGMLRNAVQLAEKASDARLESEAVRRLAGIQAHIGELEEARLLGERALALAWGGDQKALALLALAVPALLEDQLETALERIDRAIELLRSQPFAGLGIAANAQMLRGRTWRSAGQSLRALGAGGRAVRIAQHSGERRLEAEARARFGQLLLDVDRVEEAETELRDALYVAERIEDRRGLVLARLLLGILLWENHDPHAQETIVRAKDLAREIGFARAEAVGSAFEARVQHARGDLTAADTTSLRAMELLGRHGAELVDRVTIQGTRVLILETRGLRAEARAVLRELRTEVRRRNRLIRDAELRATQQAYVTRLLDAVRTPEGHVYPRTPG